MKAFTRNCLKLSVASIAVSFAMPVLTYAAMESASSGQDSDAGTLEEIVVTARKREEHVQDIPQAIEVISAQDIKNAGIARIIDVVNSVPNMILQPSFRQGVVNLSSRGHSTPQQGDPPIVLNVDGVQEPAQDFINQDLFDIRRIEVLRGPQGALYGAGAIAGAINIITNKPTSDFEGFGNATLGNGNERRFVAGISGPLIGDQLTFRLSGLNETRDGYIRNSLTNDRVDFVNDSSLRGTVYGDFGNVRLDIRATYTHGYDGASYYESLPLIPDPMPQIDQLFGGPLGRLGSDISKATYENNSGVPTTEYRNILTSSTKVDADLGAGLLTSVTGYNESRQADFGDLSFQPSHILLQDVRYDVKVFNQELRYASDSSQSFRWVGGVFYQHRSIYNQVIVDLGDFLTGPVTQTQARNFITGILTDGRDDVTSNAEGAFLNANYDITQKLTLTAAVRYDNVNLSTRYAGQAPAFLALPGQNAATSFSAWQPKLNLAYKVTPDVLAYVDLARGFRPGAANPTAAYAGGLPRFLKAETSDTAELGVKSRLFNGQVILNGDVFYNLIDDRQHYFYGASLQSMTDLGTAHVYGVETDATALLPYGFKLSASLGVMSAKLASDYFVNYLNYVTHAVALTINDKGNTLPDTPTTTGDVSLEYEHTVSDGVNVVGRIGYRYVSRIYFDSENFISDGGAKQTVDLRLGLKGKKWDVAGYVKNVTDKRWFTNYAYSGGVGNYLPNQPRAYGVDLGYEF
jgi:iron complex outermembrane receptor protein